MGRHVVQPPEWIDSAPVCVETTIEIAAPPSDVWKHVADHLHWPEWFRALDQVDITGMPTGVGGERRVSVGRLAIDEVFTAWDENEHFAFAATSSPLAFLLTLAESVRLEPAGTGCRVTYRQGLQGRRGFGFVVGRMGQRMGGGLEAGLAGLKARAES
jgi:uncharacterized protein YndB with AHSA1/START domain